MSEKFKQFNELYIEKNIIGRGNFGYVHLVEEVNTGKLWVCKKIPLSALKDDEQRSALQEANLLKTLSHPHIVQYKDSFIEDNTLVIVMEYCEGELKRRRFGCAYKNL